MNVAAIGIGGAGGRIVDMLASELGAGGDSPLATVHAVDTDTEALDALDAIPTAHRHAVGQFETGGEGTEGDRELAMEIIEAERTEIRRAIEDDIATTVDAICLVAGLAGGTGSAVIPALTAGFARVYEQPVYTVSVLPATAETDEQSRANTAGALSGIEENATAQIVFDNDCWLSGDQSVETHRQRLNRALVERLSQLLTVGTVGGEAVGERVVDTRDLMGTLDGGHIVTIGYASRDIAAWRGSDSSLVDGLKRRVFGDDTEEYERGTAVQRTLHWAVRGTLTFECPREAPTHGLLVFRGPPDWLHGDAIASGRNWLAERTGIEQLRSGDTPVAGASSLDVLVILTGIQDAPRIEAFRSGRTDNVETESADDGDNVETDTSNWGVAPGESGESSAAGDSGEIDESSQSSESGEAGDSDESDTGGSDESADTQTASEGNNGWPEIDTETIESGTVDTEPSEKSDIDDSETSDEENSPAHDNEA